MRTLARLLVVLVASVVVAACTTPRPDPSTLFVTRDTAKSPAELHQAMRDYTQQKKWLYIGDNKLKNGEVTQVRLCIREAAVDIWKAGMHLAALLPCGHFGIYQEAGRTKVTMMHPRFMSALNPHPIVDKLADDVAGPFTTMLDDITR